MAQVKDKIHSILSNQQSVKLGELTFSNSLILAPMAGICNMPFRLLMQELGAGGTVSELISSHGINHGNDKTLDMLRIHPLEKNVGLQLFGEDATQMAQAARKAQEFNPSFIDINMGCPVRKVVTKGGGSALLKDTHSLPLFLKTIKKECAIPLTIKIRTGWDSDQMNADEIVKIAFNEGINMVAIHGRTRAQQYEGKADWNYIEKVSAKSPLPIIGNGDLHNHLIIKKRLKNTSCSAFMVARGCLRNPFIFLESMNENKDIYFIANDYIFVIHRLFDLMQSFSESERTQVVQLRKLIAWFSSGFNGSSTFRTTLLQTSQTSDILKISEDYFSSLGTAQKYINEEEDFLTSGHG